MPQAGKVHERGSVHDIKCCSFSRVSRECQTDKYRVKGDGLLFGVRSTNLLGMKNSRVQVVTSISGRAALLLMYRFQHSVRRGGPNSHYAFEESILLRLPYAVPVM
jgi:hypothetical protein